MHNFIIILGISILTTYSAGAQLAEIIGDTRIVGKIDILNTQNDSSIFIGANSGLGDSGQTKSTFLGTNAGSGNTIGQSNTFVGYNAGRTNEQGNFNTFFGYETGLENNNSSENTFIGYRAGKLNNIGLNNSFFGTRAGEFNSSGFANAFFGRNSGRKNSNGRENTFIGTQAGEENSSGSENVFVGRSAGRANDDGIENTFLGTGSGLRNVAGSQNTFLGKSAGFENVQGHENTFIGYEAGANNSIGTRNTFIGAKTDPAVAKDSLDRAIAIGYKARADCDNCAIIGGTGEHAVKLGIGTTQPDRHLTIQDDNAQGDAVISLKTTSGIDKEMIMGLNASSDAWIRSVTNHDLSFWTNNTKRMTIKKEGPVQLSLLGSGGVVSLCLNANGEISQCSSSGRYKEQIQTLNVSPEILSEFRPVSYRWNSDQSADIGLIAEEVAEIDQRLVTFNKDGQIEGVKYDRLSVILIEVVKQQKQELHSLKEEMLSMAQEIKNIKSQLSNSR